MNGRKLRTYKSQLPAIRDFWQTTKVGMTAQKQRIVSGTGTKLRAGR